MTYFIGIAMAPIAALILISCARWLSGHIVPLLPQAVRRVALIRWDN